jgi:hypothetical protein
MKISPGSIKLAKFWTNITKSLKGGEAGSRAWELLDMALGLAPF